MQQPEPEFQEPANLKLLRRLVVVLLITMIAGFLALIVLFFIRFSQPSPEFPLPSEITLPDGSKASVFTQGDDWWAVVTTDNTILIYNRSDNSLRQTIKINP